MVKTLHFSGLVHPHPLPASVVKAVVVCCILDQELAMSVMSSAKSTSHEWSSFHVTPPALLSVVLRSTQSIAIANNSGDRNRMHGASLANSCYHPEPAASACIIVNSDWTVALFIEFRDDGDWWLFVGIAVLLQDFPSCWSVNAVKCLAEIDLSLFPVSVSRRRWSMHDLQRLNPACCWATVRATDLRRRRRQRAASSSGRVAPPWPRRMACLQKLPGTDPVSLRSWSVQRARGRPGRRLQSLPSERPDARPTWQCKALCAGVPNWSTASCICGSAALWQTFLHDTDSNYHGNVFWCTCSYRPSSIGT